MLGNPKSLKDDANVEKYAVRPIGFEHLNELRRLVMRFNTWILCHRDMFSFLNLDEHLHAYQARSATKGPELIDHDGKWVDGEGERSPQRSNVEWLNRAPHPW